MHVCDRKRTLLRAGIINVVPERRGADVAGVSRSHDVGGVGACAEFTAVVNGVQVLLLVCGRLWLLRSDSLHRLVRLYSRTMARRDSGASSDDGPLTARITNEAFLCPIGCSTMRDPVFLADGHSYERVNIDAWIERRHAAGLAVTSPATGAVMPGVGLGGARGVGGLVAAAVPRARDSGAAAAVRTVIRSRSLPACMSVPPPHLLT